jgi:uroporphyrin-III C-methyltransferase
MTENNKDNGSDNTEVIESQLTDSNAEVETATEENEIAAEATSVKPTRKRRFIWVLMLLVLVLLLAAVAGAGYWFWQDYQKQVMVLNNVQATLSEELVSARNQIQQLEQANTRTSQDWKNGVKSLQNLVVQSAQRLNREANRTDARWPLEEALTLARLAEQRLQLDAHASVAVGLLKSSDQVLAGLDQAAVLPLREQIKKDILALESTAAADINGHYFDLEAVADQVKNLKWVPTPLQSDTPEDAKLKEGFLDGLKKIVVVSRLDEPMKAPPLLDDFEQWRQHLLLLIEQVQLALLARNQPLFDAALQQAQAHLSIMKDRYNLTASENHLKDIARAVLNPQWPDISQSVTEIEQYLSEQTESTDATEEVKQ